MREAADRGVLKRGDLVLLGAFGGGLTWAATLLKW
jgi:3-oxoacyl-[acyl-carrier-protein] synthase III